MEHFRTYNTLDSTNSEALRLLATGQYLHGTAILTTHQTNGHGQYGRSWHAEPGSHLAMSVLLQPERMLPGQLPLLAMQTSLGVVRTLYRIHPVINPLIKWPNDIYIDERKIAGILIENSISALKVQHSIIGIGMNVNEKKFPGDLPNPVSLSGLTGLEYDIMSIAKIMRAEVMKVVDESVEDWKPEYDQLIYGLDQEHTFELDNKKMQACVLGINEEGKIKLDTGGGLHKSYFSHEIKWLVR